MIANSANKILYKIKIPRTSSFDSENLNSATKKKLKNSLYQINQMNQFIQEIKPADLNQLQQQYEKFDTEDALIDILQIRKDKRSKTQIKFLQYIMTQNFKFFIDMKDVFKQATLYSICQNLEIEIFDQFRVIHSYGDTNHKLYMIIKGQVGILIPRNQLWKDLQITAKKFHKPIQNIQRQAVVYQRLIQLDTLEDFIKNYYQDMKLIHILGEYDQFGEVEFENKIGRTFTAISKEKTYCVILSKEWVKSILHAHYQNISEQRVRILKNMPILKNLSLLNLDIIYNFGIIQDYKVNSTIYNIDDVCDYVYFIISGQVEIQQALQDNLDYNKKQREYENFQYQKHYQYIPFQELQQNQYFGEKEIIQFLVDNKQITSIKDQIASLVVLKRNTRAFCKSITQILKINIYSFMYYSKITIKQINDTYLEIKKLEDSALEKVLQARNNAFKDPRLVENESENNQQNDLNYLINLNKLIKNYNENQHIDANKLDKNLQIQFLENVEMTNALLDKQYSYAIPYRKNPFSNPYTGFCQSANIITNNEQAIQKNASKLEEIVKEKFNNQAIIYNNIFLGCENKIKIFKVDQYNIPLKNAVKNQQNSMKLIHNPHLKFMENAERIGSKNYMEIHLQQQKEKTSKKIQSIIGKSLSTHEFNEQKEQIQEIIRSKKKEYSLYTKKYKIDNSIQIEPQNNQNNLIKLMPKRHKNLSNSANPQNQKIKNKSFTSFQKYRKEAEISQKSIGIYELRHVQSFKKYLQDISSTSVGNTKYRSQTPKQFTNSKIQDRLSYPRSLFHSLHQPKNNYQQFYESITPKRQQSAKKHDSFEDINKHQRRVPLDLFDLKSKNIGSLKIQGKNCFFGIETTKQIDQITKQNDITNTFT